ncbi:hypothetical protein [Ferrimonas marina]|nr:hypothetical protein [Ferrimonas marina]
MAKKISKKKAHKQAEKELKQVVKLAKKAFKKQLKQELTQPVAKLKKAQKQALAQDLSEALNKALLDNVVPFYPDNQVALDVPLKRKPCGGCPAKAGGLCRCAVKRARKQQVDQVSIALANG